MPLPSRDPLLHIVDNLEQALEAKLTGREQEWTQGVEKALAALEKALPAHSAEMERGDSPLVSLTGPVKGALPPNAKHLRRLHQDHSDFTWWTRKLHRDVKTVRSRLQGHEKPTARQTLTRANEPSETDIRLRNLRHRARYLVASLKHHRDTETQLLLERMDTDVGGES
jgi:hypothetical protein